jgi:type VI secretion system protein ImpF
MKRASLDKLFPSLLDRLRDDEPGKSDESRDKRVISSDELKKYVLRDLSWLLNVVRMDVSSDLENYDFVKNSVLNYGSPSLAGMNISRDHLPQLEGEIREAIIRYEPRISRQDLTVKVIVDSQALNRNAMFIEIAGELWGDPIPVHLYLKTEVDLEKGDVNVVAG